MAPEKEHRWNIGKVVSMWAVIISTTVGTISLIKSINTLRNDLKNSPINPYYVCARIDSAKQDIDSLKFAKAQFEQWVKARCASDSVCDIRDSLWEKEETNRITGIVNNKMLSQ